MILIGAKGLAKEVINVLITEKISSKITLFDNVNKYNDDYKMFDKFYIIKSFKELEQFLKKEKEFIIAVGGSKNRRNLYEKVLNLGGKPINIISPYARIGLNVKIENGNIILTNALITVDVKIGEGNLINKSVIISHDVVIGNFCEISPGAKLMGGVYIEDEVEIGANATILPKIKIGKGSKIGAGSVVTKDVPPNSVYVGVPAKFLKKVN